MSTIQTRLELCDANDKTSLPWTLNTNPGNTPKDRRAWPDFKEIISYTVAVDTVAQKMSTKSFSSKNADSYAAMAVSWSRVL